MRIIFWWLLGFSCLISLTLLYFFFTGLLDGTVSTYNMGIWTILVILAILIPSLGYRLHSSGNLRAANILLGIIAVPAVLYLLFFLLLIILQPKWN